MKCFLTRVIRGEEICCLYRSQLVTSRIVPKIVRFYFCVTRFFAREGNACSAKRLRYFSPSGPSLVTVIASSAVGITCITVTPCLSCAQCHVIQFKPIVRLSPLQKERETNLLNSILWLYFFHQFHTLYSELYLCVRVFLSFYTWMMSKRAKSYNSDITEMMFPCDFCNSKAAVLYCRAETRRSSTCSVTNKSTLPMLCLSNTFAFQFATVAESNLSQFGAPWTTSCSANTVTWTPTTIALSHPSITEFQSKGSRVITQQLSWPLCLGLIWKLTIW